MKLGTIITTGPWFLFPLAATYLLVPVQSFGVGISPRLSVRLSATSTSAANDLKTQIEKEFEGTNRGLNASPEKVSQIDALVQKLEAECPLPEPARSPLMGGKWIVDYTTAPPPSNGKLGPFAGIARQIIDLDAGTYSNYLSVPGDIEKEWLSATLVATFEEWDGVFLVDESKGDNEPAEESSGEKFEGDALDSLSEGPSWLDVITSMFKGGDNDRKSGVNSKPDYGKQCWKVDFETLTIKAFGFPLINKKFEGTSRVWKTSYLDQDGTKVGTCVDGFKMNEKETEQVFFHCGLCSFPYCE